MNTDLLDCIIIGAGVSGIAAAAELLEHNRRIQIIDSGKPWSERKRDDNKDISIGFGGAGLFSDGKLSLKPAGTNLWKLKKELIDYASMKAIEIFKKNDIKLRNINKEKKLNLLEKQKYYDTYMISLDKRERIINNYYSLMQKYCHFREDAVRVERCDGYFTVFSKDASNNINSYDSKTILYTGGKNGCHYFDSIVGEEIKEFENFEIGIRLETDSSTFDLYMNNQIDCKIIENIDEYEIRTFCCCRDGIVVESQIGKTKYYNGNSDIKTDKSNIGINIRINKHLFDTDFSELVEKINQDSDTIYFKVAINDFINKKRTFINDTADKHIISFLSKYFPMALNNTNTQIFGPSVEHYGYYPVTNDELKLKNRNIWLAGDCTGKFRGLLPAFISGIVSAKSICNYITNDHTLQLRNLNIKNSSIENLKVVFTAQSKKYFYCRDAVCEYVLDKKCLPLNSFRVFDYFLSDRVNRDIIRQGNNKLIEIAEELWVFGPIADGVLFEIFYAKKIGKKIRFFSISALGSDIAEISIDKIVFEPEVHSKQITKNDLLSFVKYGVSGASTNQNEFDF